MLSIGKLEWDLVSTNLDLKQKHAPNPPPASAIKFYRKEPQKRKQSKEEYNGIWRIKAKLLEDEKQKLKSRKLKITTATSVI